jgi:hypothetical protein
MAARQALLEEVPLQRGRINAGFKAVEVAIPVRVESELAEYEPGFMNIDFDAQSAFSIRLRSRQYLARA